MKKILIAFAALLMTVGIVKAVDIIDLSVPMSIPRNFEAAVDKGSVQTITGLKTFTGGLAADGQNTSTGPVRLDDLLLGPILIADLSAASTDVVVSPHSGTITAIDIVFGTGIQTGNTRLEFALGASPTTFFSRIDVLSSNVTIGATLGSSGLSTDISAGDIIIIENTGSGGGAVEARAYITIRR